MSPRQTAEQKAVAILCERRLRIAVVGNGGLLGFVVDATCRGSSGDSYRLGFEGGEWWCSCPARAASCCHLMALQAVVAVPEGEESRPSGHPAAVEVLR